MAFTRSPVRSRSGPPAFVPGSTRRRSRITRRGEGGPPAAHQTSHPTHTCGERGRPRRLTIWSRHESVFRNSSESAKPLAAAFGCWLSRLFTPFGFRLRPLVELHRIDREMG